MPKARRVTRIDTSTPKLDVELRGRALGTVGASESSDVWYQYRSEIVASSNGGRFDPLALSVQLPVVPTPYGHRATLAFFDNLLLESDTRTELAMLERRDPSDVAGLLGRVGAECAGAASLFPTATPRAAPAYRVLSVPEVDALFDERFAHRLTDAMLEGQQVMSGAQRKLVLRRTADGWALPQHGAASTHILKRSSGRYDGLVANELACLHLLATLGLQVPEAWAVGSHGPWPDGTREPRLLAIARFDRAVTGDPTDLSSPITRLHQEDLCQITGRRPTSKYQATQGPTLRELAAMLVRDSANAAEDLSRALTLAVANVALGNGDAHGKNVAMLVDDRGMRRLAPCYDVVSTDIYPAFDPYPFAMKFGHADRPSALQPADLARLAKDFNVGLSFVRDAVARVTDTLDANVDAICAEVEEAIGEATPALARLRALVHARCTRLRVLLRVAGS
ncbi:MAG: HipA domain-containing protein [Gemmatimonadaceae bacterium]|nr:HipA domain-containing protein [Gemmatimonadaceae bacterium]